MIKKLQYDLLREDWGDYIDQRCVMYCPPAQYSPEIQSQVTKYSYFAAVSTRFLCSPQYTVSTPKTIKGLNMRGYALDNGAYLCHTKQQPFDHVAFERYLDQYAAFADWVVLPDVVCDKDQTLALANRYIDKIQAKHQGIKMLIVWQDRMSKADLLRFVCNGVGVFIGGSTEGKLQNMKWIAELCKEFGVWCHVGRVNTLKRLNYVLHCGANSFDGSGIVRFLPTLQLLACRLIQERDQLSLFCKYTMTNEFLNTWLQKKRAL